MTNEKKSELNRTRFVESLDQVRFDPNNPDANKVAYIHAEIEVLISLLFGERIVVSEATSFDSRFFTEIITKVLGGRKDEHSKSLLYDNPFKIAFLEERFEKKPVLDGWLKLILGDSLSEGPNPFAHLMAEKIGNLKFVTSNFYLLDEEKNEDERIEIAKQFGCGNFEEAIQRLSTFHPTQAKYLEKVYEYFDKDRIEDKARYTFAKNIPHKLELYINEINDVENYQMETLLKYQLDSKEYKEYSQNLKEKLIGIKQGFGVLVEHISKHPEFKGKKFYDRSVIHKLRNKTRIEPLIFDGILEFADDCYNRVISEAVGASTGQFSTRGNPENLYVKAADLFCQKFSRIALEMNETEERKTSLEFPDAEDVLTRKQILDQIKGDGLINWQTIWNIISDDDWKLSVLNLNEVIEGKPDAYNKDLSKERLEQHVNSLASKLENEDWLVSGAKSKTKSTFKENAQMNVGDLINAAITTVGYNYGNWKIALATFAIGMVVKNKIQTHKGKSIKDGIIQGIRKVE